MMAGKIGNQVQNNGTIMENKREETDQWLDQAILKSVVIQQRWFKRLRLKLIF